MLDDRPYMRADYGAGPTRGLMTRWLLGLNIGVFVLQVMCEGGNPARAQFVDSTFALSLDGLRSGELWQLFSYQFMHAGLLHLVFNGLGLYYAGRILEEMLGRPAFVALYLAGGVVGGLLQVLASQIPAVGGGAVVGASASVMTLLGAFCWQFWRQRFPLLLMFVPVVLSGRGFFFLLTMFDAVGVIWPQGNIAHFAHLGGLITGLVFMKFDLMRRLPGWHSATRRFRVRVAGQNIRRPPTRSYSTQPVTTTATSGDFISREIDPILDKIAVHGIHSLTAEERAKLERAQKEISRR